MYIKNKIQIVKNLKEKLLISNCFYIIDANGLKVEEINEFRKECFKEEVFYKVTKNTLIKKTLEKINLYKDFDFKILKGFSGILIPNKNKNPNIPAKIILNFRKSNNTKKPILKTTFIQDVFLNGDNFLKKIINLKSKNESIYEMVLLLKNSSVYKIIHLLNNQRNKIFEIFKALKKKKK